MYAKHFRFFFFAVVNLALNVEKNVQANVKNFDF